MNFIHFLGFFLLIEYITCDCNTVTDPSENNCKNAKTGDRYCCYYETPKSSTTKGCISFSKYQYDNIKTIVKSWKTFGGDDGDKEDKDVKINCKSFYLQISSIILILLFL